MVFACQRDSFLKEFTSTVVSCTPVESKCNPNCPDKSLKGYEVIMEDTILFPEGGGQPCDYGYLNELPVVQVFRQGDKAIHFVEKPLEVGQTVKQVVNWERRLDHMQQHSGQHLITAFADSLFGYETTAWWLGEEVSYIELGTTKMSTDEVKQLEAVVNEKIRLGIQVSVDEYEADDPTLKEIRTRGLPDDVKGKIRVVTITGVESDMCCGTHVSNLSQLQVIKLLGVEKGKKGKVNLHFLVGGRVLKRMAQMLEREKEITSIVNNGPDLHVQIIDKMQKSAKLANKNMLNVLKELAVKEAELLKAKSPRPKFFSLHRKEADVDFLFCFIREVGDTETLLFLTVGEDKGAGQMILHGDETYISKLGPELCSILDGKGNGKGTKFQAKVKNLGKRKEAIKLIEKELGN